MKVLSESVIFGLEYGTQVFVLYVTLQLSFSELQVQVLAASERPCVPTDST